MPKSTPNRQSSNKSGVRSTSNKIANSRHGFETQPASRKKGGAFGHEKGDEPMKRKAGTASTREGKSAALQRTRMR
jgi:hypothetical protein